MSHTDNTDNVKRARVAWFSPRSQDALQRGQWSPAAYCTSVLLPHLHAQLEIDLFHDAFEPDVALPAGMFRGHFLTAAAQHRNNPYDLFFYHLEDSRLTAFARIHLGLKPGMVWFHDFFLSDDGPEPILNSPWERVVMRYADSSTPWPARDEEFTRPKPWAIREAALGGIPIFSTEKDLREFQRTVTNRIIRASSGPTAFFLPYPVSSEAFLHEEQFSQRTGEQSVFRVGLCAAPRIEARVPQVLEALARVPAEEPVQLLWMVPGNASRARAEELIEEFGVGSRVQLHSGDSFDAWRALVPTLDLALHPHFSVFGQPGVPLALSMAGGVPVVVTDFGSSDYLPDSVVVKVQPGVCEVGELREIFIRGARHELRLDRTLVQRVARERFDARAIASDLVRAIRRSRVTLNELHTRWSALEHEAHHALLGEVSALSVSGQAWFECERELLLEEQFKELGWSLPPPSVTPGRVP